MQHLEDGFLHALADGEVPSEELGPVREHLESCESCRARLDEARMEAETARELIELIEVPALAQADRRIPRTTLGTGSAEALDRRTDGPTDRQRGMRWARPLAWAATLVLAAGVGYYGRGRAPFAAPAADRTSVAAKLDTVFLDIPAQEGQVRENEATRNAAQAPVARSTEPQSLPAVTQPASPARSDVAGARPEEDKQLNRRKFADTTNRVDELTKGVAAAASPPEKQGSVDKKETEAKLDQNARQRAANAPRDERVAASSALKAAPPAPTVALAEERLMAKSAADAAAVVVVTFPRAVELLGGRIKLIEGMVPARLEATGRVVRVIYTIDEGDVVLAQVSGTDSLNWNLSGPVGADSLAKLRRRVR